MLTQGICYGNRGVVREIPSSGGVVEGGFQSDFVAFEDFESAAPVGGGPEFPE